MTTAEANPTSAGVACPSVVNPAAIFGATAATRPARASSAARPMDATSAPAPSTIAPAPARSIPAPRTSKAAPNARSPAAIRPICGSFQIRGMMASTKDTSACPAATPLVTMMGRAMPNRSIPAAKTMMPAPATRAPAPNMTSAAAIRTNSGVASAIRGDHFANPTSPATIPGSTADNMAAPAANRRVAAPMAMAAAANTSISPANASIPGRTTIARADAPIRIPSPTANATKAATSPEMGIAARIEIAMDSPIRAAATRAMPTAPTIDPLINAAARTKIPKATARPTSPWIMASKGSAAMTVIGTTIKFSAIAMRTRAGATIIICGATSESSIAAATSAPSAIDTPIRPWYMDSVSIIPNAMIGMTSRFSAIASNIRAGATMSSLGEMSDRINAAAMRMPRASPTPMSPCERASIGMKARARIGGTRRPMATAMMPRPMAVRIIFGPMALISAAAPTTIARIAANATIPWISRSIGMSDRITIAAVNPRTARARMPRPVAMATILAAAYSPVILVIKYSVPIRTPARTPSATVAPASPPESIFDMTNTARARMPMAPAILINADALRSFCMALRTPVKAPRDSLIPLRLPPRPENMPPAPSITPPTASNIPLIDMRTPMFKALEIQVTSCSGVIPLRALPSPSMAPTARSRIAVPSGERKSISPPKNPVIPENKPPRKDPKLDATLPAPPRSNRSPSEKLIPLTKSTREENAFLKCSIAAAGPLPKRARSPSPKALSPDVRSSEMESAIPRSHSPTFAPLPSNVRDPKNSPIGPSKDRTIPPRSMRTLPSSRMTVTSGFTKLE